MINSLTFEGNDWFLSKDEIDPTLLQDLIDCGASGPADEAVAYVMNTWEVTGDPIDCKALLKGQGAWKDNELDDHDENLKRLVWLTGCALRELEGKAYFSIY